MEGLHPTADPLMKNNKQHMQAQASTTFLAWGASKLLSESKSARTTGSESFGIIHKTVISHVISMTYGGDDLVRT